MVGVIAFYVPLCVWSQSDENVPIGWLSHRWALNDTLYSKITLETNYSDVDDYLCTILTPEYNYRYPIGHEMSQNIYSFIVCKKVTEENVQAIRYVCNPDISEHALDSSAVIVHAINILQIDSVMIDGEVKKTFNRKLNRLLKKASWDEKINPWGLNAEAPIFIKVHEKNYDHSYRLSPYSSMTDGVVFKNMLCDLFSHIKIDHKYALGETYVGEPAIRHGDNVQPIYEANYDHADINIVKTCKSSFRRQLKKQESIRKNDEVLDFYNNLIFAAESAGIDLETEFDIRFIYYIENYDLYAIVNVIGHTIHRVIVGIRDDGKLHIDKDQKMSINNIESYSKVCNYFNDLQSEVYCYSLDEPKQLIEIRTDGQRRIALFSDAYCAIIGKLLDLHTHDLYKEMNTTFNESRICFYPLRRILGKRYKCQSYRWIGVENCEIWKTEGAVEECPQYFNGRNHGCKYIMLY